MPTSRKMRKDGKVVYIPKSERDKAGSGASGKAALFAKMRDDQKAETILAAITQDIPDYLNKNSDFQKLIYYLDIDDKPTVVDDKSLDKMDGLEVYRAVNAVRDNNGNRILTAPQIAKQTQEGKMARVSHGSRAIFGDGIYFTSDKSNNSFYMSSHDDVQETCIIRAKLNSNARVITYQSADSGAYSEIKNNSNLGKALQKCKPFARLSIYAYAKGFNVIEGRNGNFSILDRSAITMSDSFSTL